MNKENLDLETFYYVEPLRIIDNADESVKEFFKFFEEDNAIENFLKDCSLNDFIWLIIKVFKDNYADGGKLSALISKTFKTEKKDDGTICYKNFLYRKDLNHLKVKYNVVDHFEYLEFEINPSFSQINVTIEDALTGKNYTKNGNKYILSSDSGIEYIEVTSSSFKLKANMSKSKRFH